MNIVIVTQKPIQTIILLYMLGSIDVFPKGVFSVSTTYNHKKLGLLNEEKESLDTLKFQCSILKIPLYFLDNVCSYNSIKLLQSLKIDLILSFVTDTILTGEFIETSKHGVVSAHGGILPKYRGVDCLRWAILNGEEKIGVSTQLIDPGVDTGDIIDIFQIDLSSMVPCSISDLDKKLYYKFKLESYLHPVKQLKKTLKINSKPQKNNDGKQYFSMHPQLKGFVDKILMNKKI